MLASASPKIDDLSAITHIDPPPGNDPLGTLSFRDVLVRRMAARHARLSRAIHRAVVTRDAFGLKPARLNTTSPARLSIASVLSIPERRAWVGEPESSITRFSGWYTRSWTQVVLETETPELQEQSPYWSKQLERAYVAGISWADEASRRVAAIERLSTRLTVGERENFLGLRKGVLEDLMGIRESTADRLRRLVRQGFNNRWTADELARQLVRQHVLGQARALTVAKTAITHVHAEASLNALQTLGFTRVTPKVEFTLNVHGSAQPCPICSGLSGLVVTVRGARGMIPVHPNCQCGWVPID